jgi:hypothetical protein
VGLDYIYTLCARYNYNANHRSSITAALKACVAKNEIIKLKGSYKLSPAELKRMATERDLARKLAKAGDDDISDNILEYQVYNYHVTYTS